MGVQFNLLPDVKLEFDRQQRTKRMVYTLSVLACVVVVTMMVISFVSVNILQKKLLSDADKDIQTYSKKLKGIPDLDKVLTIQNQLKALPGLQADKHITSRFFTYLPQVTPSNVFVGKVTIDMESGTISIDGTSDKLETVNAFVDTLKFTTLKVTGDKDQEKKPAFTDVILTNSGRNDRNATYSLSATFDPVLFDSSQNVSLVIPKEVTTRSVTQTPDINGLLFNGETADPKESQGTQ